MTIRITHQCVTRCTDVPHVRSLNKWVRAALQERTNDTEITLRIVDENESRRLNNTWRHKDSATNVLSFPAALPDTLQLPLLGDLVICAKVVNREAKEQGKTPAAHWAHMVIHGCLHLSGYDHEHAKDATIMENCERHILATLGFPDPYDCH